MAMLNASNGSFNIIVDDNLLAELSAYTWKVVRHPQTGHLYARRWVKPKRRWQSLHAEVMLTRYSILPAGYDIDHENGDTLDCRFANLRFATRSQNNANHRKRKDCRSQYKGVMTRKSGHTARITVAGKRINLGTFKDEAEAARAYDAAAKHHYGVFAKTNF